MSARDCASLCRSRVLLHPPDERFLRHDDPIADPQRGKILFVHQLIAAGRRNAQHFRYCRRVQEQRQFVIAFVIGVFVVVLLSSCPFFLSVFCLSEKTPPTLYPYSDGFCTKLFSKKFALTFSCTTFAAFVRKKFGCRKKASHY